MKRGEDDPDQDFYGSVAAELRQPLTTISGYAQHAKQLMRTDPDRASEALDQVVAQIGRMKMLLGELRDRARDAENAEVLFKT
jgi:C4-dicarboxylate-specific signal transduction histidine kinase